MNPTLDSVACWDLNIELERFHYDLNIGLCWEWWHLISWKHRHLMYSRLSHLSYIYCYNAFCPGIMLYRLLERRNESNIGLCIEMAGTLESYLMKESTPHVIFVTYTIFCDLGWCMLQWNGFYYIGFPLGQQTWRRVWSLPKYRSRLYSILIVWQQRSNNES